MKLINLAPGHPPRSKSHFHGSGGIRGHFHAPIPANDRRILPHPLPTFWTEPEDVEPLMVMDPQMKLINLAPGHPPRCKSHSHVCGSLLSHFLAPPICTSHERNLPVRKFAPPTWIWPMVEAPLAMDPQMHESDKPCPWTSPKK